MVTHRSKQSATTIRHGTGRTPIGDVFVALSERGVCALFLQDGKSTPQLLSDVRRSFPDAEFIEDRQAAQQVVRQVTAMLAGEKSNIALDIGGTPFQQRVWKTMCRIPRGATWSYSELARKVGKPKAVRAVANACARNPIGILVPCHRIIRDDGSLGGYGWGLERKRALLRCEQS
jgi:AraC family transcriptional regulator of adaptative response/methylated-DNA-[protein]-cysteine methyltransferase